MTKYNLQKGTLVKIGGIPLRLMQDTPVLTKTDLDKVLDYNQKQSITVDVNGKTIPLNNLSIYDNKYVKSHTKLQFIEPDSTTQTFEIAQSSDFLKVEIKVGNKIVAKTMISYYDRDHTQRYDYMYLLDVITILRHCELISTEAILNNLNQYV